MTKFNHKKLAAAMEDHDDMSSYKLADLIGDVIGRDVSRAVTAGWVRGAHVPSTILLYGACQVLNLNMEEMFFND
jgi:hypothetical protein